MFKTDLFLDATSVLTFVKIRIYIKIEIYSYDF